MNLIARHPLFALGIGVFGVLTLAGGASVVLAVLNEDRMKWGAWGTFEVYAYLAAVVAIVSVGIFGLARGIARLLRNRGVG